MKNGVVFEAKTRKYHIRYWESLTWAARQNRNKETESEKILWNKLLRGKHLGYKFTRQKPLNRFIADFYCSELNLVIEVDGESHNSKKGRDYSRDEFLKSCGIKTLRIDSNDVINNLEKVEKTIKNFINPLPCQGKG